MSWITVWIYSKCYSKQQFVSGCIQMKMFRSGKMHEKFTPTSFGFYFKWTKRNKGDVINLFWYMSIFDLKLRNQAFNGFSFFDFFFWILFRCSVFISYWCIVVNHSMLIDCLKLSNFSHTVLLILIVQQFKHKTKMVNLSWNAVEWKQTTEPGRYPAFWSYRIYFYINQKHLLLVM